MKKILIVSKRTLEILQQYDAEEPCISKWGGEYGDEMRCQHIACPSPLDPDCVKIVRDQMDNMMVVTDIGKAKAKQETTWAALREKRNDLLAKSDWTQTLDAPLNSQDRDAWKTYRQALRDMPETTSDPQDPNWPEKPDAQV